MRRLSKLSKPITQWRKDLAPDDPARTRIGQLLDHGDPEGRIDCGRFVVSGHASEVISALLELGADGDLIADAISYILEQIGRPPPPEIGAPSALIAQLREIDQLEADFGESGPSNAEGMRRLLLALVTDVRALVVILADRLAKLRAVAQFDDDTRRRFARSVQAIHAPLANRLGIWQFKWELEDLVFRYLQPDLYQRIARLLDERRLDRENYIAAMVQLLTDKLAAAGVNADIKGRPKHIYSIWRKMQRKNLAFDQLYDVRAVRVLTDGVTECYAALGLVHGLWQPVPGEFDDYIANPKSNGYQSLHTAVFGPQGKPVEIQIRTHTMHEQAELGFAAHWRYKEGGGHDPSFQRKLNAMRALIEGGADEETLLEDFGADQDEQRIYVLTPRGKVVDLKAGATVLDFAYHIHTDIGHRCRGAKVNGRIVPLHYAVRNGQQVEILTGREPSPSRDWMVEKLGFLRSARARAKVRQWFKRVDFDRNVADGKDLLDREFKRLALREADVDALAPGFNKTNATGVYAAIGLGEITPAQIANAVQRQAEEQGRDREEHALESIPDRPMPESSRSDEVLIEGVGNLLTNIAKCCAPVPGDEIIGYLTRHRGISVHRENCRSLAQLVARDPARVMEVSWGEQARGAYKANLQIDAYDRRQLLNDVSNALTHLKVQILSLNASTDESRGKARIALSLRVAGFEQLSVVIARLSAISGVYEVRRTQS